VLDDLRCRQAAPTRDKDVLRSFNAGMEGHSPTRRRNRSTFGSIGTCWSACGLHSASIT